MSAFNENFKRALIRLTSGTLESVNEWALIRLTSGTLQSVNEWALIRLTSGTQVCYWIKALCLKTGLFLTNELS